MIQGPLYGGVSNGTQVPVEQYGDDPIAIYRDTVARFDAQAAQNITGYLPFRLKAPNIRPIGFLGISEFDSINTDIGLQQLSTSILRAPQFGYPFVCPGFFLRLMSILTPSLLQDVWAGNITFVAANNDTILRTGRLGSDVQRLYGAGTCRPISSHQRISH